MKAEIVTLLIVITVPFIFVKNIKKKSKNGCIAEAVLLSVRVTKPQENDIMISGFISILKYF
jgi:hypothetical protein